MRTLFPRIFVAFFSIAAALTAQQAATSSHQLITLTLAQAEAIALKNNPQISVAHLPALASQQVAREERSNLWPTATGDITGVDAQSGTRMTAGALNNPIIYERVAAGVVVTQLITDFGRTTNLAASAGNSSVALSWSASSGATSYNIFR